MGIGRWTGFFVLATVVGLLLISPLIAAEVGFIPPATELETSQQRRDTAVAFYKVSLSPPPEIVSIVPTHQWTQPCDVDEVFDLWWPNRSDADSYLETHEHRIEIRAYFVDADGSTWITVCGDPESF